MSESFVKLINTLISTKSIPKYKYTTSFSI